MEKIIVKGREACKVHILSRSLDQFTPDVEFHIEIYLPIVIVRYKKFQIVLIHGGDGSVRGLYRPEYSYLRRPVREGVKLATNGRYLRG